MTAILQTKSKEAKVNFMRGLIAALVIMCGVVLLMCIVYKRTTGSNFLKDLFHDIFTKE